MIQPPSPRAPSRSPGRVREETIHAAIARRIGSAILSGQIKPGDTLGGEIAQSQALGVSRAAYREAMRLLLAKGLVETRQRTGAHVAPEQRWNLLDPEIIGWILSGDPDPRFIRDLLELRSVIEPAAAAMAATRRSEAELVVMTLAIAEMSAYGLGSAEGQEADRRFHNCLLTASGNKAFVALSDSIEAAVKWITIYKQRLELWESDLVAEHRAILEGITAGNAEQARAAMAKLLDITLANVVARLDQTA